MKDQKGFSLIEILIYTAIFSVTAIFLVNILTITTRIQARQSSLAELNQQIFFVASTIERLVRDSSLIENPAGEASSTLTLRMASSTLDPTKIFVDAGNTAIFIQEGSGQSLAITNNKVKIDRFWITKFENPGGRAVVQIDLTISNNTSNVQHQFTRTIRTAIARISAANFDSDIIPGSNATYDVGSSSFTWNNAYFSGNVGIGTTAPGAKLGVVGGDITTKDAGKGLVVKTPDGSNCYRLGVDNSGNVTSTSVTCP